jgi:hypothetical protein
MPLVSCSRSPSFARLHLHAVICEPEFTVSLRALLERACRRTTILTLSARVLFATHHHSPAAHALARRHILLLSRCSALLCTQILILRSAVTLEKSCASCEPELGLLALLRRISCPAPTVDAANYRWQRASWASSSRRQTGGASVRWVFTPRGAPLSLLLAIVARHMGPRAHCFEVSQAKLTASQTLACRPSPTPAPTANPDRCPAAARESRRAHTEGRRTSAGPCIP